MATHRPSHEQAADVDHSDVRLHVSVLGGWAASFHSGLPLVLPVRKAQALLAFLALAAGQFHARSKLMTLLWGDQDERLAGQNLRRALYLIRRSMGGTAALVAEGDTIALAPEAIRVDALEFERLASVGTAEALEQATGLYRGELLEGLDVGAPVFEEWLRGERERFFELAVDACGKLLACRVQAGQDEAAVQAALRLLALDPAQEPVHRTLMRLYHRLGRRAAALRQYQLCVDILRRELGAEPDPDTTEIYLGILQGDRAVKDIHQPIAGAVRRSGSAAIEVPLVGRAASLRELMEGLDAAAAGDGRLVLITGEAGIGKTRLLGELQRAARHRGWSIVSGYCHQTEQVLPFRPFIEALREGGVPRAAAALASLSTPARAELARLFPELGGAPREGATTPETRAWLFEAVCDLLGWMAHRQSLLLTVEDIHWADDMTLRLLAFAARRLASRRILVVATLREEDVDDAPGLGLVLAELAREPAVARLALGALSEAETRELVSALGPSEGGEERVAERATRIWRASRGHPLVVVETMREILEHGHEADTDPTVPPRVRELIAARLARLAEPLRHLVAVTAVVGEPVTFELLIRAGAMIERETAEALEQLIRRRILQSVGERFEFSHERVRQVAYETLLPARRRLLHRAVGEAMETRDAVGPGDLDDRLAHHFSQARVADKAITYLTRFAETARRRNALEDALRSLDRAITLVDDLGQEQRERRRLDLVVKKSFVLAMLERQQEVLELLAPFRERVDALGDPAIAGPYAFRLGMTYARRGDLEQVDELARRALEDGVRCGDEATIGRAHYLLATRLYYSGHSFEAGVWHARQAIARLEHVGEAHHRGWAYFHLASHLHFLGDFGPALEAAARPESIGDELHEPRLRGVGSLLGAILTTMGDWKAGVHHCERALARATDPVMRAAALGSLGYAYTQGGDSGAAISALERAIEMIRHARLRAGEVRYVGFLADAKLLAADVGGAREAAARALTLSAEIGHLWGHAWAERSLGRTAWVAGDHGAAEGHLGSALERFEALGARFEVARTRYHLAALLHACGRLEESRAALAAARERFESLSVPIWAAHAAELGQRLAIAS